MRDRVGGYLPTSSILLARWRQDRGTGNGILISTRAFAALPVERPGLEGAGSRKLVSKVEIWLPTFQLHGAAKQSIAALWQAIIFAPAARNRFSTGLCQALVLLCSRPPPCLRLSMSTPALVDHGLLERRA